MWNDLVQVGVPQSDGITTSELFCQWQKLTPKQKKKKKKIPLHPISRQGTTWQVPKQQKGRSGGSSQIIYTVVSYHKEDQHLCVPSTIKHQSGGILPVLALVDNTGAEVTVLHRDINGKEAAPQSTEIPSPQAKVTLTEGNTTPFTTIVLITTVEEYILGIDVLAG